jgi:hypothetical protein
MKRTTKVTVLVICTAVASLTWVIYIWFHGYFDPGKFEIKQAQWSPSKQVAILAERSDQQALGGLTYFVLIGNHLFSAAELRHAYHSNARIFAATSDCIDLRWESPSKLVIACRGSTVDSADIDVQKRQSGNIAVSYENIAIRGSLTSEKWNRITQEIYDFAALFDSLEGEGKAA